MKRIFSTLVFICLSSIIWAQSDSIYTANYWLDVKSNGSFAKASENPINESVIIIKRPQSITVTFGKKRIQYEILKTITKSEFKTDYHVTVNSINHIMSIAKIPNGKIAINIEKLWMVPDARLSRDRQKTTEKNTILITKQRKVVPKGKKWVLMYKIKFNAETAYGVGISGTYCNAMFYSNPQILNGIYFSRNGVESGFYILFDSFEKVTLGADNVYLVNPVGFLSTDNSIADYYLSEMMIEFKEGDEVYISNCLTGIELIEMDDIKR